MKYLKVLHYFDLAIQTLLMGYIVFGCIYVWAKDVPEAIALVGMWGAMYLGPWQMFSALVNTLAGNPLLRLRIIHLAVSILYLGAIVVAGKYFGMDVNGFIPGIAGVLVFGIPAVLAFFYYYITAKTY